jgi:mechanosensitive ion channel-like protein
VDLHERRELDMSAQVARVKARARPWRSIIALFLALCGLAAGELGRYSRHLDYPAPDILKFGGAAVFLVFGLVASFGLSGQARDLLRPRIGAAHAGVARYALVLAGIFTVLVITLNIASVPVGQLVLGGAVTGVLLGIAAQQSLSNLFAGMVLLFARPFRVGDRVRFRAGALAGLLEGTVTDISIAYVRLETTDGLVFVPNSQALAACVGPLPPPEPDPEPPAAAELAYRDAAATRSAISGDGADSPAVPGESTASSESTVSSDAAASRDGTGSRNGTAARD